MIGTQGTKAYHFYIICCLAGIIRKIESFRCNDGREVQPYDFCNGRTDCLDRSDEEYGCNRYRCGQAYFTCIDNLKCIGIHSRCNGISDCIDASDERYCDDSEKKVKFKTFRCVNGEFIRSNEFCDGNYNCHDKSDEGYGCNRNRCQLEQFACDNQDCTSIKNRCNGISDCLDGSDERYCDQELKLTGCTINEGKFLCKDELRCIDLNYTCDGYINCFDGSDETDECNKYNSTECSWCSHACIKTPERPHCFYNSSTNTMDVASKDLSDCEFVFTNCSQKCSMYKDRQYCDCEENYLYNSTTNECIEQDKNSNMLLYTTSKGIKAVPSYKKQTKTIMEHSESITALSAANGYVYWGGIYNGLTVIGKVSLQGGEKEIVISNDIEEIKALDVDWKTGNIYFIDNKRKRLTACTEKKQCVEIHKISYIATALSLAPRYGYMFWSTFDEQMGYVIRKSDMNGENQYPIVENDILNVTSISVDETSQRLYWCDGIYQVIEEIHFSGINRRILAPKSKMNFLAVTVNAGFLYWILLNKGSIQYFQHRLTQQNPITVYWNSLVQPLIPQTSIIEDEPIHLIYGFSNADKTTKLTPPCNWGCDGICLITSNPINRTRSYCITIINSTILRKYNLNEDHHENGSTLKKSSISKTTSSYYIRPTTTETTTKTQDFNNTSTRHHDCSTVTVPNFINRTDPMLSSLHRKDETNGIHIECSCPSNSTFNIIIGFTTFLILLNIIIIVVVIYFQRYKWIRILGNKNKRVSSNSNFDLEL